MSGSLVKILYILHWLVLDASIECSEAVSLAVGITSLHLFFQLQSPTPSTRQLTYSMACIQQFVYLLAPLVVSLALIDDNEYLKHHHVCFSARGA